MHVEVVIRGIVQGVGFRPFIYRIAAENGLKGYVRNRGDAGVEIVVEGCEAGVKRFIKSLREKKPPISQIYDLSIKYSKGEVGFKEFTIMKSREEGELSGSIIPSDIAICEDCLRELRDPKNRRYNYFFITCTQCGPRFTIIEGLPYDRPKTTMKSFPMCEDCREEYTNPLDRRFHAQTVACAKCGPRIVLTTRDGKVLQVEDPVREAGKLVEEGFIVAIKGNGGFHIATSTLRSEPIKRLRRAKHRSQKPFAVMGRSLEAIKSFVEVDKFEEKLLTSSVRPIILLRKKRDFYLSELVSPGLHNIGVMLPYTGLHYMLFDDVKEPAFIMTSANPPSEPIVIDDHEALKKLGSVVDYFLLHNRAIANRCDDSVVRFNSGRKSIIRRSRGYAPMPIRLKNCEGCSLGLGAEENVNSCIIIEDRAFISQYIGDIDRVETFRYLRDATEHLMNLTRSDIGVVGCDMHPSFITKRLAEEYGHKFSCPVFPVQHHYAHILSLMGEWGLDEIIGICCDGAGYGLDGKIWGGEVLHCTLEGFERVGHLQYQPMVGGDQAAKYPLRMAAGILYEETDIREWLSSKAEEFTYGEREVEVIMKQLERKRYPLTSSCGRILDAVSAILGVCYERTYEGEPAIKLESEAVVGRDVLGLKPRIAGNVIDTSYLIREVFYNRAVYRAADLAFSAETYLAKSLASIAVGEAESRGVHFIGFSGGVAYNEHITRVVDEYVRRCGLKMVFNQEVPSGDGGVSFGQALRALKALGG